MGGEDASGEVEAGEVAGVGSPMAGEGKLIPPLPPMEIVNEPGTAAATGGDAGKE